MQKFTPRQSSIMAKTLRDVIHAYGLSKEQLAGLAKVFGIQETSVRGMEVELIRAMNDSDELDWSKKRR